jgi:type VI secretion system protein ImpC
VSSQTSAADRSGPALVYVGVKTSIPASIRQIYAALRVSLVLANASKFRIALIGDFSGRSTRLAAMRPKLAGVKPVSVDSGNFEDVMESMGVEVRLGENGDAPALRFRTMDDFHPDEIYTRANVFHAVRAARNELKKSPAKAHVAQVAAPADRAAISSPTNLLDAIVDAADVRPPGKPRDLWDQAIQQIVAPHCTAKPDPQQEEVRAQLDSVASEMMRVILGHPDFQSIEAAWRSVFLLLRHLETSDNLTLELIDVSREELVADLLSATDIQSTGMWRLLVDEVPGAIPWSVCAALYRFGGSTNDFVILGRIAEIAQAAGAPFVAEAHSRLARNDSAATALDAQDSAAWHRLRSLPEARWVGLAMPRFMLRLPYGAATSSIDSFAFEEMPALDHDGYLWGNPAVACVCLLGETFQAEGHRMRPGSVNRLDGVPIHCYRANEATPPAEVWMTDRAAGLLLDRGLMPLASIRNSDSVQLVAFRSIAEPPCPLSGPWNRNG